MTEPGDNGDPSDRAAQFTERLAELAELPVAEHAELYQQIHADLQAALAEIDAR